MQLDIQTVILSGLTSQDMAEIMKDLYSVYSRVFSGRSLDSWLMRAANKTPKLTVVELLRDENEELVGFTFTAFTEINYNGEKRTIIGGGAALVPSFHNENNILMKCMNNVLKRYMTTCVAGPLYLFDNIISPMGYNALFLKFPNIIPNPNRLHTEEELSFVRYVAKEIAGMEPIASLQSKFLSKSNSLLSESDEKRSRSLQNSNSAYRFFSEQTGLEPGKGLSCIAKLDESFLHSIPVSSMKAKLKLIILDFDYTLADTSEVIVQAVNRILVKMGKELVSPAKIKSHIGISLIGSYFTLTGDDDEQNAKIFEENCIQEERENKSANHISVYPTVAGIIEFAKKFNLGLAIFSSKRKSSILQTLKSNDLLVNFSDIVGADDVTQPKPHPEGILEILSRQHLTPEEVVMVGDSLYDARAAKQADVPFVAVITGTTTAKQFTEEKVKSIIPDLSFLPFMLAHKLCPEKFELPTYSSSMPTLKSRL